MSDLLSQYAEATARYIHGQMQADEALRLRRAVLAAMRNDGMTSKQIGRLVGLPAGTVAGMIAKSDRDFAELTAEAERE